MECIRDRVGDGKDRGNGDRRRVWCAKVRIIERLKGGGRKMRDINGWWIELNREGMVVGEWMIS